MRLVEVKASGEGGRADIGGNIDVVARGGSGRGSCSRCRFVATASGDANVPFVLLVFEVGPLAGMGLGTLPPKVESRKSRLPPTPNIALGRRWA